MNEIFCFYRRDRAELPTLFRYSELGPSADLRVAVAAGVIPRVDPAVVVIPPERGSDPCGMA